MNLRKRLSMVALLTLVVLALTGCGKKYTLTCSCDPIVGGSVLVSPSSPDGKYSANTIVTLTATPAAGYGFSHWTGDSSANAPEIQIVMDGNKSLTAVFEPAPSVPQNLAAAGSRGHISLSWNASSGGNLTGYNIYRSDGGEFVKIDTVLQGGTPDLEYDDPIDSSGDGVMYQYRVTAQGNVESAPSAIVSCMHGTRIPSTCPTTFIVDPAGSPYVIEGTVSFGSGLTVQTNAKLYVLEGSVLNFTSGASASPFSVSGLLRMTGTSSHPITINGTASKGFYMVFSGAVGYGTGDGTLLEYVGLANMGSVNSISIQGCSPRFHDVKLLSTVVDGGPKYFATSAGVIVENCSFDGLGLSLDGDLSSTPLSVTHSTFGGHYGISMWDSNTPYFGSGQITNNSFNCSSDAADIYLYNNSGTGSGDIHLENNFWHEDGSPVTPNILQSGFGGIPTFNIIYEPMLGSATGIGATW